MSLNSSIQKAFRILSFIATNPQRVSLSKMSRQLAMNKTTLFRLLNTLISLNLIEKKGDGYVLGVKLFELGNQVPVKQLILEKIHPILVKLVEEVNETVNLGELTNKQLLYLDKVESRRSLQIQTYIGSYASLHSTALGKASLSILMDKERDSTIAKIIFEKKTKNTITDPQKLKTHIEIVDKKGYSLDNEELEVGLNCVAVPLALPEFDFCGAISFSGPSVRFTRNRMTELAKKLKATVMEIKETIHPGESN